MARKSVTNRNQRRVKIADKFREKRDALRAAVSDQATSDDDRWEAMLKLQELPRDSSRTRQRNRCRMCSRPRAYNRLTGLCRLHMRAATISGMVPGMHKASW